MYARFIHVSMWHIRSVAIMTHCDTNTTLCQRNGTRGMVREGRRSTEKAGRNIYRQYAPHIQNIRKKYQKQICSNWLFRTPQFQGNLKHWVSIFSTRKNIQSKFVAFLDFRTPQIQANLKHWFQYFQYTRNGRCFRVVYRHAEDVFVECVK